MKHIVTKAIVLQRINYGEADRILTLLTPDQGKLSLMAKGVRRERSKLAGGVELFSLSEVSFMPGRGEVGTLTSSRLTKHFANIVNDIDKTMLGYDLLKYIHKTTEDQAEAEYYDLLAESLEGLNDTIVSHAKINLWFNLRLLMVSGYGPDIQQDTTGKPLREEAAYQFNQRDMQFEPHARGNYNSGHIKLMRIASQRPVQTLARINGTDRVVNETLQLLQAMRNYYLHI